MADINRRHVVNPHADTSRDAAGKFLPEGDERRRGEIVVVGDPLNPGLAITDSEGSVQVITRVDPQLAERVERLETDGSIPKEVQEQIQGNTDRIRDIEIRNDQSDDAIDNADRRIIELFEADKAFDQRIKEIEKNGAVPQEMKDQLASNTDRIERSESRVDSVETRLGKAESDISGLSAQTEAVKTQVSGFSADISRLEKRDTEIEGKADANTEAIDGLSAKVDESALVLDGISYNVDLNTGKITKLEKTVPAMEERIGSNAKAIEELRKNPVGPSTEDFSALEGRVQTNTDDIALLKTANISQDERIQANADALEQTKTDMQDISSKVEQSSGSMEQIKADVERIDAKDAEQDSLIQANSDSVITVTEKTQSLESEIAKVGESVGTVTGTVDSLSKAVDTIDSSVLEINKGLADIGTSISDITERVDAAEAGLAGKVDGASATSSTPVYIRVEETQPGAEGPRNWSAAIGAVTVGIMDAKEGTVDGERAVPAVDGLATALDVKRNIGKFINNTVNGKPVSGNPVLEGRDIVVSSEYAGDKAPGDVDTDDRIDEAIRKIENMLVSSMSAISASLVDLDARLKAVESAVAPKA